MKLVEYKQQHPHSPVDVHTEMHMVGRQRFEFPRPRKSDDSNENFEPDLVGTFAQLNDNTQSYSISDPGSTSPNPPCCGIFEQTFENPRKILFQLSGFRLEWASQ